MQLKLLSLLFILLNLNACSVFMAASSSGDHDSSQIQAGLTRRQIEAHLGRPITFLRQQHGDVATYQILSGDKADYHRAAAYALLDGLTLGAAELISFPTEALQGDQHLYEIVYDNRGRAKAVKHTFKPAAAPNPTELIKEEFKSDEAEI